MRVAVRVVMWLVFLTKIKKRLNNIAHKKQLCDAVGVVGIINLGAAGVG